MNYIFYISSSSCEFEIFLQCYVALSEIENEWMKLKIEYITSAEKKFNG